jgi:hypothetical protein
LERYEVRLATFVLANDGEVGRYVAVEPPLTERERLSRLLDHLFMIMSPEDAADPSKRLIPNMVEAARSQGFLMRLPLAHILTLPKKFAAGPEIRV